MKSKTTMRRSTLESWLTEPENPEPAHDPAGQYIPAPAKMQVPPKVQAAVRQGNKLGLRVVSAAEFRRTPGVAVTPRRPRVPRAPREATNTRTRGSRRGTRAAASSSDDPDPEPPPAARLCACGCGQGISHRRADARYVDDTHSKRSRRAQARRDRVEDHFDDHRHDPYRDDRERLLLYAVCRCNGGHILERDPELGHRCCKCGRQRPDSAVKPRLGVVA
jgi:hypothetical protein